MKCLCIYAFDSIFTPKVRIALCEESSTRRDGEFIYAIYTSSRVDMIFARAKDEAGKNPFELSDLSRRIAECKDGSIVSYVTSPQGIDTSLFAFLTGDADGEMNCSIPFIRKRKNDPSVERWTVVEVR